MRTLVVEDDAKLGPLLRRALSGRAGACDLVRSGEDAIWMAKARTYDAIVLDVMLPCLDGYEVCARLRDDSVWTPVLLLTARDAVEDRVHGLDAGADDYLTKPFSLAELRARLRALVRRGSETWIASSNSGSRSCVRASIHSQHPRRDETASRRRPNLRGDSSGSIARRRPRRPRPPAARRSRTWAPRPPRSRERPGVALFPRSTARRRGRGGAAVPGVPRTPPHRRRISSVRLARR